MSVAESGEGDARVRGVAIPRDGRVGVCVNRGDDEGSKMETDEIGRKLMIRHAMSCHVLPAIAMWCYYLLYMSPRRIEYVSG